MVHVARLPALLQRVGNALGSATAPSHMPHVMTVSVVRAAAPVWLQSARHMGRGPTIQGKKNATDVKRTAMNAKLAHELAIVSKMVQGDKENVRLQSVISKAKAANMPKDKIDAAIKRGVDNKDAMNAEAVLYEASGPGGSALMIETLTDNKRRTAPALRHILGKHSGSLGTSGSVAWMFERKGYMEIELAKATTPIDDEDALMEIALEGGAEDFETRDGVAQVTCEPTELANVRDAFTAAGLEPSIVELIYHPKEFLDLPAAQSETFEKLLDALNDNEDVNQIHHNVNEHTTPICDPAIYDALAISMDALPPAALSPCLTSPRGMPLSLSLADRVALYCHQSTAANNAGVLRNVPKPTAPEIAAYLRQCRADGIELYDDAALVRLLLTDSDYDAVCREILSLPDALAWHAQPHSHHRTRASTTSLQMLLMATHVFTADELHAAHEAAASGGSDKEELEKSAEFKKPVAGYGLAVDGAGERGVEGGLEHYQYKTLTGAEEEKEHWEPVIATKVGHSLPIERDAISQDTSMDESIDEKATSLSEEQNSRLSTDIGDPAPVLDVLPLIIRADTVNADAVAVVDLTPVESVEIPGGVDFDDHVDTRNDKPMKSRLSRESSFVQQQTANVMRAWIKDAVGVTINAAVNASVKRLLLVQDPTHVDRKTQVSQDHTEAIVDMSPRENENLICAEPGEVDSVVSLLNTGFGIEAPVQKNKAECLDICTKDSDPDDLAFEEDVSLFNGQLASTVMELKVAVDRVVPYHGDATAPPTTPMTLSEALLQLEDTMTAVQNDAGGNPMLVERVKNSISVDVEDHGDTREYDAAQETPMQHEWIKDAVEATVNEVVGASVKQLLLSESPPDDGDKSKENEHHAEAVTDRTQRGDEDSASTEPEAAGTVTSLLEAGSGIDTLVHKLDSEIVDFEDSDPDDLVFGKDASLFYEQLASTAVEVEVALVHTAPDGGDATERPSMPAPLSGASCQLDNAVEARYQGAAQYVPEIITAVHEPTEKRDISDQDCDTKSHVCNDLIRLQIVTPTKSNHAVLEKVAFADHTPIDEHRVGDAVEARYHGLSQYFPGEIAVVVGSGRYDVRFADGEYESEVSAAFIRPLVVRAMPLEEVLLLDSSTPQYMDGGTAGDSTGRPDEDEVQESHSQEITPHNGSGEPLHAVQTAHAQSDTEGQPSELHEASNSTGLTSGDDALLVFKQSTDEQSVLQKVKRLDLEILPHHIDSHEVLTEPVDVNPPQRQSSRRISLQVDLALPQQDSSPPQVPLTRAAKSSDSLSPFAPRITVEPLSIGGHIQEQTAVEVETTPVVPFKDSRSRQSSTRPARDKSTSDDSITNTTARAMWRDWKHSDRENDPSDLSADDAETFTVDRLPHATERIPSASSKANSYRTLHADTIINRQRNSKALNQKKQSPHATRPEQQPAVPVLSPSTMRYLSPQRKVPVTARTPRLRKAVRQSVSTPRTGSATDRSHTLSTTERKSEPTVSWKEMEEWKNVDLILTRKRRVVHHGQVGGSDVPWGEEFAAIQSLKRFSMQYPDVLRDHIECQLAEVMRANRNGRDARVPTTHGASAARDALYLIKDLAFLLRHRLAPFFDVILPAVLPAVFHTQKRFLCDTAYEVLEALVMHCSSRKLVVTLLKQAQRFPRDDLRLVNLTCLYVEKCLASLSVAAIHELLAKCATSVLDAIAELLTRKSAACQSSLQKSLLMLQTAVGEGAIERLLINHLVGNALALVRWHLTLAESAANGANKSPSASPKKLLQQQQHQHNGETPAKHAPTNASISGSILQRMLAQRQNRVVPAPE